MARPHRLLSAATLILLTATACGNVASDDGGGEGGSSAEAPPGITDDTIVLGATLPLTGTAAVAGQGLEAGLRLAADEINEAGGINGRQVELTLLDDGFTPDRVVANVRRLVSQDEVYALVAPAGSQGLPGAWPFIAENGTPVWGPVSPSDPNQQEVYLLGPTRTTQGEVAIDYFASEGHTRLAVILQDNDLGVSAQAALDEQLPKHPEMELVAQETTQTGGTDVSSAVNNVVAANPDAVLLATDNTQVALVLQQLRSRGVDVPVFADQGGAGTGGPSAVGPAGDAAEGFIGGLQVNLTTADNPDVAHWRELGEQYEGEQGTSGFSLQTYSYLKAFAELLERMGDDLSYENFHAEAEALVDDPISLGTVPDIECAPLPDGHTCVQSAGLAVYTNGAWELLQDFQAPE
jgi:branched-chain amino acid transport system substrate-binding protein